MHQSHINTYEQLIENCNQSLSQPLTFENDKIDKMYAQNEEDAVCVAKMMDMIQVQHDPGQKIRLDDIHNDRELHKENNTNNFQVETNYDSMKFLNQQWIVKTRKNIVKGHVNPHSRVSTDILIKDVSSMLKKANGLGLDNIQ